MSNNLLRIAVVQEVTPSKIIHIFIYKSHIENVQNIIVNITSLVEIIM